MLLKACVGAANQALRCFSQGHLRCFSKGAEVYLRDIYFPDVPHGLATLTAAGSAPLVTRSDWAWYEKKFQIKKPLSIGSGRLAQVYRGCLKFCDPDDALAIRDPSLNDVVLKIYDSSHFPTGKGACRFGDYSTQ